MVNTLFSLEERRGKQRIFTPTYIGANFTPRCYILTLGAKLASAPAPDPDLVLWSCLPPSGLEFLRQFFETLTIVHDGDHVAGEHGDLETMLDSDYFTMIFTNNILEHVGDFDTKHSHSYKKH
jgi:hypothetical protein